MQKKNSYVFHCPRFDTRLLKNVVSIDVDAAIERLWRDSRITIDAPARERWIDDIYADVSEQTFAQYAPRSFMPDAVNARIKQGIDRMIHEATQARFVPPYRKIILKSPLLESLPLCRFLGATCRILFQKRME